MTERRILHSTFTLERTYPAPPARVFAAWGDPAAKARWFAGPEAGHELDFRIGGREVVHRAAADGLPELRFEAVYQDIVPGERIVYVGALHGDRRLATVSLTSVQFHAVPEGTRLELTEHGAFLDGQEQPSWRERGTSAQLDALTRELHTVATEQL